MPFPQSADSLRAKLHISEAKLPAIIGVCLAALIALVLVIQSALGLLTPPYTEIHRSEEQQTSAEQGEASSDASSQSSAEVFVHVTGAVVTPGMYGIAEGSRVQAAIDAAGGFSEGADTLTINVARIVVDGEQIIVATEEETAAAQAAASSGVSSGAASSGPPHAAGGVMGGKVNINTADGAVLDTLPGVGPSTAEKIIAEREANGPFITIEDLRRVSGIGEKKYEQLADLICVG